MPWDRIQEVSVPASGGNLYVSLTYGGLPGNDRRGLSLEAAGGGLLGRLRVGFLYPSVLIDGEWYVGPCVEMAGSGSATSTNIHALTYGFFPNAFANVVAGEEFGAVVAVDRGIVGAKAVIWRYS